MTIAAGQVRVGTAAVQIVAARAGRTELRLFGLGSLGSGNRVLIGPDNTTSLTTGYFEAGSLVLTNNGAVWGISTGTPITVSYLELF